jgi:hypothetical protein
LSRNLRLLTSDAVASSGGCAESATFPNSFLTFKASGRA